MEKEYINLSNEVSVELIDNKISKIYDGCEWYQINGNESSIEEFEEFNLIHLDLPFNERNLINEYIENLIIGLSNIIDIFEPEAISFGGSFVYFKDLFYNKLTFEMQKRKYTFNKDVPKIVLAELKNDAGMIGAVL